jgi:rhamnose utilization protein RhaD (predicted bifunctional aldolase and dehydrogenase)
VSAFARLRAVSATLGADPRQVQGAGGNTSLKRDGAMWIKASGTWLAEAERREIFVPVDLDALRAAIERADPAAESAVDCVAASVNPSGLRPSIETTVHAVCPSPVVIHTHCVNAIAVAMRADGETVAMAALEGMGVVWIPYVKPGLMLSHEIARRITAATRVLVLGNHGLVACGATVAEAEATLREASRRLAPVAVVAGAAPSPALVAALEGADYAALDVCATQAVALDPDLLARAASGSFWPDHVIFLGRALAVAAPGEGPAAAAVRLGHPPLMMLPGLGAALRVDASAGARALALCVGDVFARVDPAAPLCPFTEAEEDALLNWDAEKYRQSLDRKAAP